MRKRMLRSKRFYLVCVFAIVILLSTMVLIRFYMGKQKAEREWHNQQPKIRKITNLGTTNTLEIMPLIDWHVSHKDLKREAGVSYLIKTDTSTILFDVGLNRKKSDPSPLVHNMNQLGVGMDDIDTIFISHNHPDHVGGLKWLRLKTFSITNRQVDLGQKRVYTPIPMTYPGLTPICAKYPTIISEGVATVGTISNQLFFGGWTPEQALAVNVKGKGIVLIVGCGHQTLPKLLQRTEALFAEPIFGLIGGLHYPVTGSRVVIGGVEFQRYVGTGKVPWRPITMKEVQSNIEILEQRNPKIVGVSGHDSCDASIAAFRKAFPKSYQGIIVGERIVIGQN